MYTCVYQAGTIQKDRGRKCEQKGKGKEKCGYRKTIETNELLKLGYILLYITMST